MDVQNGVGDKSSNPGAYALGKGMNPSVLWLKQTKTFTSLAEEKFWIQTSYDSLKNDLEVTSWSWPRNWINTYIKVPVV